MAGGWIKLHRSILDWRWYGDQNTRIVFIHLLLTANHKDKAWRGITIKQGQRAVSYEGLAEELQLSVQNIRTAIKHLKSTGELTSHLTGSCPIITIQNYGKYQALYSEGEEAVEGELTGNLTPKLTGSQQAANRLLTPNKNIKKERTKEDKNTTTANPSDPIPYQEIQKTYNETCVGLPKVVAVTDARRKAIRARWNTYPDIETFRELFTITARSDFLNGSNDRSWRADFDWLLKEHNMAKVLEGKFDFKRGIAADAKTKSSDRPSARYVEHYDEDDYKRFEISSMSDLRKRHELLRAESGEASKENA